MPPHRAIQSAIAVLLTACVLLLGLAAVSPELHEGICHHEHPKLVAKQDAGHEHRPDSAGADHDNSEAGCVVHLFAHGCDIAVPVVHLSPPSLNATKVAQFTELMLSRTLRGPERVCGPPARV